VIVCPEVVHNLSVWIVRLLHRRFRKRFVLVGFMDRPRVDSLPRRVRQWLLRRLRASADALVSYTDSGRRALEAEGWPAERIFVSQNTIDTERAGRLRSQVSDGDLIALRRRLGIGNGRVVLFIGKLIREKRVDLAIRAVKELKDGPVLVVVGDGPERGRLEQLAQGTKVVFAGAEYDEVELAKYLALGDFLLLPGRVGLTCVLGFASGLPCVTTSPEAVVQTPEFDYVVPDVNGLVVATASVEEYASAVDRLITDGQLLERLKAGARETASGLRVDRMVDSFAAAMRSVAKRELTV
jgi:glycosyltransferase involved in cell wall biosynthesis